MLIVQSYFYGESPPDLSCDSYIHSVLLRRVGIPASDFTVKLYDSVGRASPRRHIDCIGGYYH